MKIYAVVGNPVLHSISPALYRELFRQSGIDAMYTRLTAESAEEALSLAQALELDGLNVTSPFKEDLSHRVDRLADTAKHLQAVNTIVFDDGSAHGYNTDPAGVVGMLNRHNVECQNQNAVVIGAGGAGRAAALALVSWGARVTIVNRTLEKGRRFADNLGCSCADLDALPRLLASTSLLFSCLPGDADVIEESWLSPGTTVVDANYHRSRLVEKAKRRGCRVLNSTDWLIYQALESFWLYTGKGASYETISHVLKNESVVRPYNESIALIGMDRSGKSVVGRALAERLGWSFVDIDQAVRERVGGTMSTLLAAEGVRPVRAFERDIIDTTVRSQRTVIVLGAHSVADAETMRLLSGSRKIWLWADMKVLQERNLLGGQESSEHSVHGEGINEILRARRNSYASAADIVVNAERPLADLVMRLENEVRQTL